MPALAQWNLVDSALLTNQDTTNCVPTASPFGGAFAFNNGGLSTAGLKSLGPVYLTKAGGVNWSIFGLATLFTGGSATHGAAIYCERGLSGNDIIKLNYTNTGNLFQVTIRNDAGTLVQVSGNSGINDLRYHSWLATKFGTGGSGNVILYQDGISSATGNWIDTDSYTDAGLAGTIGYDIADTSGNLFGAITIVAAWTRALSPVEAIQLNSDPFAFIALNEDFVAAMWKGTVAGVAVKFRKTFSQIGGRVGSRQPQGWAS
jgi:hypothetical protein